MLKTIPDELITVSFTPTMAAFYTAAADFLTHHKTKG